MISPSLITPGIAPRTVGSPISEIRIQGVTRVWRSSVSEISTSQFRKCATPRRQGFGEVCCFPGRSGIGSGQLWRTRLSAPRRRRRNPSFRGDLCSVTWSAHVGGQRPKFHYKVSQMGRVVVPDPMNLGKARRRVESMLREIWPEAPFSRLPNAGHVAQAEAHGTFVAMIKQFGNEN
jgi:hypothetical protein